MKRNALALSGAALGLIMLPSVAIGLLDWSRIAICLAFGAFVLVTSHVCGALLRSDYLHHVGKASAPCWSHRAYQDRCFQLDKRAEGEECVPAVVFVHPYQDTGYSKVKQWWETRLQKSRDNPSAYHLMLDNCSTTVKQALLEGCKSNQIWSAAFHPMDNLWNTAPVSTPLAISELAARLNSPFTRLIRLGLISVIVRIFIWATSDASLPLMASHGFVGSMFHHSVFAFAFLFYGVTHKLHAYKEGDVKKPRNGFRENKEWVS